MFYRCLVALTALSTVLYAGEAHATAYTFTTINDPSVVLGATGTGTAAYGINNKGQIVGYYVDATGTHGYLDTNGAFTTINAPGGTTRITGINDSGTMVGYIGTTAISGFADTNGTFTIITNGATTTTTYAINNAGQIAGFYSNVIGSFVDTGGSFSSIYGGIGGVYAVGMNDNGAVVGIGTGSHSFLSNNGVITSIDAPTAGPIGDYSTGGTYAGDINNLGQIVGWYANSTGSHGFMDIGGVFTIIDDPDAVGISRLSGINDAGQLVGSYTDAADRRAAFI